MNILREIYHLKVYFDISLEPEHYVPPCGYGRAISTPTHRSSAELINETKAKVNEYTNLISKVMIQEDRLNALESDYRRLFKTFEATYDELNSIKHTSLSSTTSVNTNTSNVSLLYVLRYSAHTVRLYSLSNHLIMNINYLPLQSPSHQLQIQPPQILIRRLILRKRKIVRISHTMVSIGKHPLVVYPAQKRTKIKKAKQNRTLKLNWMIAAGKFYQLHLGNTRLTMTGLNTHCLFAVWSYYYD